MSTHSFHTFLFPFQWKISNLEERPFSEQIDLKNIHFAQSPNWERWAVPPVDRKESDDLYNERNYFYEFVHPALYDDNSEGTLLRHFERREPKHQDVTYRIVCGQDRNVYELDVQAINLNLYSTGVGVLSFYLYNTRYPDIPSILSINQYGRRVFPPFIADVQNRDELAHELSFDGLNGVYSENFSGYNNGVRSNTPASFITKMVKEVAGNITLQPVVDDRMFVLCWYKNDEWSDKYVDDFNGFLHQDEDWYKLVFVDNAGSPSCQNDGMRFDIIQAATYERWQKWHSLYGVSRYSMVYLTNSGCPDYLISYFETEYARMAELVLMQRATVLRFSAEVTDISNMSAGSGFTERVSSLYKEYIRFENQIYFREVSAQDQGIEMYQKLYGAMNIKEQVEKLDDEIEELHNYVALREDLRTNRIMSLLTWITTIFLPVTVVTGFFSMTNAAFSPESRIGLQAVIMLCFALLVISSTIIIKNKKIK